MVICKKAGERDKCKECEHAVPHNPEIRKGCDCGRCYPDTEVPNTITGEPETVKWQIPCEEIKGEENVQ